MENTKEIMRNCCVCKKPIMVGSQYYHCSVSTCNKKSNPQSYCSIQCWDVHVPVMNHKGAWACEETAVSATGVRKIVASTHSPSTPKEILIVASKLKQYVKDTSDFNTSANVMDTLSDIVRMLCDKAIENARAQGRKTLMDRDFEGIVS